MAEGAQYKTILMMKQFFKTLLIPIFLFFAVFSGFAIDISGSYNGVSKAFEIFMQKMRENHHLDRY